LLKSNSKVFINTQIIKWQQEPRGREIKVSQKEVLKYISDVTQEWFPAWQQEPRGRDIKA
jgi:hypothetical protein